MYTQVSITDHSLHTPDWFAQTLRLTVSIADQFIALFTREKGMQMFWWKGTQP